MELKDKHIKDLIIGYLTQQSNEKEIEELLNWIDQSDEHKSLFLEYKRVWELAPQGASTGKFSEIMGEEWSRLSEKLPTKDAHQNITLVSVVQKIIRIAAVFLLLVSLGATYAWYVTNQKLHELKSRENVHQVIVPMGGRSEVVLPDGSKVTLNAGSQLSYSGCYGYNDRKVMLEGEGYFEIETDQEKPFVVMFPDFEIQALGTIFNVKAYPDEGEIITTLVEGVVRIKGEKIDYTMKPSQRLTYMKNHGTNLLQNELKAESKEENEAGGTTEKLTAVPSSPVVKVYNNVNTPHVTAWKDGFFVFHAERLSDLAVILERKFDISFLIDSELLKEHKFTGTFHKETLEQVLDVISMSAPINYQIEEGIVNIQLDKRRSQIFERISRN